MKTEVYRIRVTQGPHKGILAWLDISPKRNTELIREHGQYGSYSVNIRTKAEAETMFYRDNDTIRIYIANFEYVSELEEMRVYRVKYL